jgi:hypothetical protein
LMDFIQKHQILGKVSAFVWRIEYQKEVFYILISSFGLTSMPRTLMRWSIPDSQKILLCLITKAWCPIFANCSTHIKYVIILNVADFPMVSVSSVILKKWPDTQGYVVTAVILPGMQKKEISCLIILRYWHPFELIIARSDPFRTVYRIRPQLMCKEFWYWTDTTPKCRLSRLFRHSSQ